MAIQLRQLRIRVRTETGTLGTDIPFYRGLNILRAPNSKGKSTCLNSIVYALGIEGMWGPSRKAPLTSAVTDTIDDGRGFQQVLSASVALERVMHFGGVKKL